jgi:GNAT superfamily N-acetyltransferase
MLEIRAIHTDDHAVWLELWRGYLEFYETDLTDDVTQYTFERIVDPASGVDGAIAWQDGRAVGLVHWLTHQATWSRGRYCYLEDLFVSPHARGSGTGRALITRVRDWAADAGCEKVYWLTAETNTRARALYDQVATRSGFIHYQLSL